jgi:hypothetical protein
VSEFIYAKKLRADKVALLGFEPGIFRPQNIAYDHYIKHAYFHMYIMLNKTPKHRRMELVHAKRICPSPSSFNDVEVIRLPIIMVVSIVSDWLVCCGLFCLSLLLLHELI